MAVTANKGVNAPVRDAGANNGLAPHGYVHAPYHVLYQDRVQLPAGTSIGSTVLLGDFDWQAILDPFDCQMTNDAAGAAVTINVGCDNAPAALVAGQSLVAAGTFSLLAAVDRSNFGKPLWQLMGFATLKAAQATATLCRIYATTAAFAMAADTDLFWTFKGTNT